MDGHHDNGKSEGGPLRKPRRGAENVKQKQPLQQLSAAQKRGNKEDSIPEESREKKPQVKARETTGTEPLSQSDKTGTKRKQQKPRKDDYQGLKKGPLKHVFKRQERNDDANNGEQESGVVVYGVENRNENKRGDAKRELIEDAESTQEGRQAEWSTEYGSDDELDAFYRDETEERGSDSDSMETQHNTGSGRYEFLDDNPLLARVQGEKDGEIREVYLGDISDVFEEKNTCVENINAINSDELSEYLGGIEKHALGRQVSTRNITALNAFWQIWDKYAQNGQLKQDHLRHIYEKLEKEDFLRFFGCLHQNQYQLNCQQGDRGVGSTKATFHQNSGLGRLLMNCVADTPAVTHRGRRILSDYDRSQVTKQLFAGDDPSATPHPASTDTAISPACRASISPLQYVSSLDAQGQKTQAPTPESETKTAVPSSSRLAWWKKAAQTVRLWLIWTVIAAVAIGLGFWAHTVLSPLPIMKAQSVWLLLSCATGVGVGWFSAVVVMMRQGQGKNARQQGAHMPSHENRAAVKRASASPLYAKYSGVITAIDKVKKTVFIQVQDGAQQARNALQLQPTEFSYQPVDSADLDQFGKELEKRQDFADKPDVSVTVDKENARFTMEIQAR